MKRNDISFGNSNERKVLEYLNNNNSDMYHKTKGRFCYYDFYNTTHIAELKSRRNAHNTYPTTMVSQSKIDKSIVDNKKIVFYFLFTDGLYLYTYNPEDKLEYKKGGRNDRSKKEINNYCYIPIKLLELITESIKSI